MLELNTFEKKLGDWWYKLEPFFKTKEAEEIYSYLKQRSKSGHKIYPYSDNTFRAFQLTNPKNINAIIIGMSPYHTFNNKKPHADGLCFSSHEETPSLKLFKKAISKDLKIDYKDLSDNLDYLAHQGVLLLNASLTSENGKPSIHLDNNVWDKFNKFLYENVLSSLCGIPIITCGKEAKKIADKYLFKLCHVVKHVEHPAFAARNNRDWDNDNCFKWINEILLQNNNMEINFDYKKWLDLPF